MNTNKDSSKFSGSICTRCGKQRIISGTYKEKTVNSYVTYTVAICSDPECQKVVDKALKDEENRRSMARRDQQKREAMRKLAIAEKARATQAV